MPRRKNGPGRDCLGRPIRHEADPGPRRKRLLTDAVDGIIRGQSWNDVTGLPPYQSRSHKVGRRPTQTPVEESRDVTPCASGSDNVIGQKWTQASLW